MGWLWATAEINALVLDGMLPVPRSRWRFARKDLAWDYPVSRSRVDAFYDYD